jgi:hypothetical protein
MSDELIVDLTGAPEALTTPVNRHKRETYLTPKTPELRHCGFPRQYGLSKPPHLVLPGLPNPVVLKEHIERSIEAEGADPNDFQIEVQRRRCGKYPNRLDITVTYLPMLAPRVFKSLRSTIAFIQHLKKHAP